MILVLILAVLLVIAGLSGVTYGMYILVGLGSTLVASGAAVVFLGLWMYNGAIKILRKR